MTKHWIIVWGWACGIATLAQSPVWSQDGSFAGQSPERIVNPGQPLDGQRPELQGVSLNDVMLESQPPAPPPPPAPPAPQGSSVIFASATTSLPAPSAINVRLQETIRRAMQQLDAQTLPAVAPARQRLHHAILDLQSYVATAIGGGGAWEDFLRLEQLKQEIDREQPDIEALVNFEMHMRQNYLGLEYPQFVHVRQGINELVRALRYGSNPERTLEQLRARMTALVDNLEQPSTGAANNLSSDVGLITNYLHESGQVPWAVTEIRNQFRVPNLQVYAHERFLSRALGRPLAEPRPVNECILGTRIVGQACMLGDVSVDVHPMAGGASLSLNLSATMTSNNTGYNRGVTLQSSGRSPVWASKTVFIGPHGISSTPASVATDLQTTIHSINHRMRLVRRIASRKAAQQKPMADAIAEQRLQRRVQSQYDQEVDQQLAQANSRWAGFQNQPRPVLPRLGIPRPNLQIHSTDQSIHGDVIQAADFQLSAAEPSPLSKPAAGVLVEAHQSAVVNALDIALGGRTIRSADLDDYVRQFVGSVPAELVEEAEGEPWSITMAAYHPVEVELDDGRIKARLRISSMTRGEQRLADPALITATYLPSFEEGRVVLRREGAVDIDFARVSRGIRAVTLRSFLKGKFDRLFQEEIVTEQIAFGDSLPNAPAIALSSFTIDDGWLQIALQ